MPPKRRNNKKKNRGKAKGDHKRSNTTASLSTLAQQNAAAFSNSADDAVKLKGKRPTLWENKKEREKALHEEYPTIYSRYKNATKRFIGYMETACPSEMGNDHQHSTNSLLAATDYLVATNHVIDNSILKDLKLAIRIRSRVAKSVYGGGDAGHKYFLHVLTYCWSILNSLPKTDKVKHAEEDKESNHFAALMEQDNEDDDIGDDGNDEEIFPTKHPVLRPSFSGPEPLSLDDLMKSDERIDCIIFLLSLDEIMGSIAEQYRTTVLKAYRSNQSIGCPETAIVEELLESAVASNLAIQQVQKLEMDLMVQHDHLTTPYRLLATMVFPEITQDLTATVREHGATTKEGCCCTERDITIYLGDCLESYFRNPSDPFNRKDDLVKEFCKKWEIDSIGSKEFEDFYVALDMSVKYEIPIASEKEQCARSRLKRSSMGLPETYSWIKMQFIGGGRAIHHTLRLLQTFGDVIRGTPNNKGIEAVRGYFGKSPWVPGRSRNIPDLDELLLSDILPKWVLMCRKGILGQNQLPRENELCPLFVLLRNYVKEPEKPVSWSLSFAIHAVLTAILEVDPIVDRLVEVSNAVFQNYFTQLNWAKRLAKNCTESLGNPKTTAEESWWHNMVSVSFLENLGLPVFGGWTLWNPLCSGTILSYLNYFGNLEAGCAMIDCHAQLRITLHLFHALLVNGILRQGEIPMLDKLYDGFRNSKAIWGGRRLPKKGEFVQRFWICFGCNIAEAKKMAEQSKQIIHETQRTPQSTFNNNNSSSRNSTRRLVPIEASEISRSYRRICHRDFHDVVDKYHTPEQRSRSKGTDFYHLMVNTNDTLDAIEEEQHLFSINLPSCSAIVEAFVNSLGNELQWEPILRLGAVRTGEGRNDQRQGFSFLFAQYLLGGLDFANDPSGYDFMNVPLGTASSHFMRSFFSRIDTSKVLWFQSIREENSKKKITSYQGYR